MGRSHHCRLTGEGLAADDHRVSSDLTCQLRLSRHVQSPFHKQRAHNHFQVWLKLTGAGWRVDDFQEIDSGWPASAHAIKTLPSFKKNQQAELKTAPAK